MRPVPLVRRRRAFSLQLSDRTQTDTYTEGVGVSTGTLSGMQRPPLTRHWEMARTTGESCGALRWCRVRVLCVHDVPCCSVTSLTSSHLGPGVAAGRALRGLDVIRLAAAARTESVNLLVATTERESTLSLHTPQPHNHHSTHAPRVSERTRPQHADDSDVDGTAASVEPASHGSLVASNRTSA